MSRLADRLELSADPRQRDLARLLSAIVADGPTERKLFGDDDVPGGIDDDDDPDWDKEPF